MNKSSSRVDVGRGLLVIGIVILCGCEPSEPGNKSLANTQETLSATPFEQGKALVFDAPTRYEYPKAIELLEQAISESPEDPAAHATLAYAYAKRSNYPKILEHVEKAKAGAASFSESQRVWLAALTAKANDQRALEVSHWQDAVALEPNNRWAWYELASAHANIPDYAAAALAAEKALSIEPDPARWESSWIYYLHSKALFRNGQAAEAVVAAAKGEGLETTWRSTYYRMAMAQIAAGDQQVAESFVDDYRKISNTEGRNSESYTEANIALFYFELGNFSAATKHAQNAFELDPKAYQTWTLSFSQSEMGQPQLGLDTAEAGLSQFPDDPMLMAAKAWALFRLGQTEQASSAIAAAQTGSKRSVHFFEKVQGLIVQSVATPSIATSAKVPWLG
ncbi:MAG: tetratricopeptide repeat protein [Lysobacterales bacterium]